MPISYSQYDLVDPVNNYNLFVSGLMEFVQSLEGTELQAYLDNVGIPTIGIGYNLRVLESTRDVLLHMGFDPNRPHPTGGVALANGIMAVAQLSYSSDTALRTALENCLALYYPDVAQRPRSGFEFLDIADAEAAFPLFAIRYDDVLGGALNEVTAGALVPHSRERLALVSLAFNGGAGLIGPGLRGALTAGNRPEAWFEIRHGSNGGSSRSRGIQKRRYIESQIFGLYQSGTDASNITLEEATSVYSMYSAHRVRMLFEENEFAHSQGGGNGPTTLELAHAELVAMPFMANEADVGLEDVLEMAAARLRREYIPAGVISGDISALDIQIAGSAGGVFEGMRRNGYALDVANGNAHGVVLRHQNDLLIGGAGIDIIRGFEGNDALVGLGGADSIEGGTGDDYIAGGDGDDTLSGDTGNDYLEGGAGHDTYRLFSGDGTDTILDSDGQGAIVLNVLGVDHVLNGAGIRIDEFTWRANDGLTTYRLEPSQDGSGGQDLVITTIYGNVIRIANHTGAASLSLGAADLKTEIPPVLGIVLDSEYAETDFPTPVVDGAQIDFSSEQAGLVHVAGSELNNHYTMTQHNDVLVLHLGDDFADGQAGNDSLIGWSGRDRLEGGDGNDTLYGEGRLTVGNDLLVPFMGDATDESDLLVGGAGQDTLVGEFGHDLLYANDVVGGETRAQRDREQDGTGLAGDALDGGEDDDVLVGDAGNDLLLGGAGADVVFGGGGDDLLIADSSFSHGANLNYYNGMPNGPLQLTLTSPDANGVGSYGYSIGPDAFLSTAPAEEHGDDQLHGGRGNDQIYAGGGRDYADGGDGNDLIVGEGGDDTLFGGAGDDVIEADVASADPAASALAGNDYVDGGDGDDDIFGGAGDDLLFGGAGNDFLAGDRAGSGAEVHGDDVIDGGAGNDSLVGYGGDDQLSGGAGDDYLAGDADEMSSGGNDVLQGGAGNDTLIGHAGDDVLDGGDGNDLLRGGLGNDTYVLGGGTGTDTIEDLEGVNRIRINASANDAVTSIASGDDLVLTLGTQVIVIKDAFSGSTVFEFEDGDMDVQTFTNRFVTASVVSSTSAAGAQMFGGGGNDQLQATGGNSTFASSAGNDTLTGALSSASAQGGNVYEVNLGDGNDTIRDYGNRLVNGQINENVVRFGAGIVADQIRLTLKAPNQLVLQLPSGQTLSLNCVMTDLLGQPAVDAFEFEDGTRLTWGQLLERGFDFEGTAGAETISGGNLVDRINGNGANDVLNGNAGNDVLNGGDGNDTLNGHAGNDTLLGGSGNDTLNGGEGVDAMVGGVGNDIFYVDNAGDTITEELGSGTDTARATTTYALSEHVENLTIEGAAAADGTGNAGANTVTGNQAINRLYGLAGNDTLVGQGGNDEITGGRDNDALDGGAGNDTYFYAAGDGNDTITNTRGTSTEIDTLVLTDVLASALSGYRIGDNLVLVVPDGGGAGSTGTITLSGYFGSKPIDQLQFSDQSTWTRAQLSAAFFNSFTDANDTATGTTGDDVFTTLGGNDVVSGLDGNDTLDGGAGNDTLHGGNGNDALVGGIGTDTLNGNAGDDVMTLDYRDTAVGGAGNDTYIIATTAEDQMTISNVRTAGSSEIDRIVLPEGISPDDITIISGQSESIVLMRGASYFLTLSNFLNGTNGQYEVDLIEFADGTVWTLADIMSRLAQSTFGGDALHGGGRADEVEGGHGNDTVNGRAGNDILHGDEGDDTLQGGAGDDTLDGGLDRDRLEGGAGNDIYAFDEMSGTDTVVDTAGVDALSFGAGISAADVTLVRVLSNVAGGDNLIVMVGNGEAEITVQGHFGSTGAIERIQFSDGTVWNAADIAAHVVDERAAVSINGSTTSSSYSFALPGGGATNLTLTGSHDIDGTGNSGANIITGNAGNNILYGGAGVDTLIGGLGDDYYRVGEGVAQVNPQNDGVVEAAGEGTDTVEVRNYHHTLAANVENMIVLGVNGRLLDGVTHAVIPRSLNGNSLDNVIDASNVALIGMTEATPLRINGYEGADTLIGSRFDDTYVVDNTGDEVVEWSNTSIDAVESSVDFTLGENVENLLLTGSASLGIGNAADNQIQGNATANVLEGGDGNDVLIDSKFPGTLDHGDVLRGGMGDDELRSMRGNDTLDGGEGNDVLFGNSQNTHYVFREGDGHDVISDNSLGIADDDYIEFIGIEDSDVRFVRAGMDLVISVGLEAGEGILIANYFDAQGAVNTNYEIEEFRLAGGVVLGRADVLARLEDEESASAMFAYRGDAAPSTTPVPAVERAQGLPHIPSRADNTVRIGSQIDRSPEISDSRSDDNSIGTDLVPGNEGLGPRGDRPYPHQARMPTEPVVEDDSFEFGLPISDANPRHSISPPALRALDGRSGRHPPSRTDIPFDPVAAEAGLRVVDPVHVGRLRPDAATTVLGHESALDDRHARPTPLLRDGLGRAADYNGSGRMGARQIISLWGEVDRHLSEDGQVIDDESDYVVDRRPSPTQHWADHDPSDVGPRRFGARFHRDITP